jgi:GNAT superfamily N-acetyltransferase
VATRRRTVAALAARGTKRTPPPVRAERATPAPHDAWSFEPLTRERWADFASLFGEKGACAGCWCMWMRLPAKEYREKGPEGRKSAIRRLAGSEEAPGLLAYEENRAVGWIAVGPREAFRRLETSRVMAPVDERDVWCTPCFFVARTHRRRGLTRALVEAACLWAAARGACCVEAYPVDTKGRTQAAAFIWHGVAAMFEAAGFREVARRSPMRPIMRRAVRAPRRSRARG